MSLSLKHVTEYSIFLCILKRITVQSSWSNKSDQGSLVLFFWVSTVQFDSNTVLFFIYCSGCRTVRRSEKARVSVQHAHLRGDSGFRLHQHTQAEVYSSGWSLLNSTRVIYRSFLSSTFGCSTHPPSLYSASSALCWSDWVNYCMIILELSFSLRNVPLRIVDRHRWCLLPQLLLPSGDWWQPGI